MYRKIVAVSLVLLLGCSVVGSFNGTAIGQDAKPAENIPKTMRKFQRHGQYAVVEKHLCEPGDIVAAYRDTVAFSTIKQFDDAVAYNKMSQLEMGRLVSRNEVFSVVSTQQVRVVEVLGKRPNFDPEEPNYAIVVEVVNGDYAGKFCVVKEIGFDKIHPDAVAEFNIKFNPPPPKPKEQPSGGE